MNIFPQKPIENRQKSPEFATPGDIRGMARHIFEVDSSVYDTSQQMGRYNMATKTAIQSVQRDAAIASRLTSAVAEEPGNGAATALDIEQIRAQVNQEAQNV